MDHVQCAKDLLRDPITTVDDIRRNLKTHIEQLPVAWSSSRVRGEHSVDVFVNFLAEVRRLESENPKLAADKITDLMGTGSAVLYYETVNVLRMIELSMLALFKVTNEVRQALGYLPTLEMKLNPPLRAISL